MNIKIFLFFILAIAFLMFYQQNPVYTIIIVMVFLITYFMLKIRKKGTNRSILTYFSGKDNQENDKLDEYITFMMLQQLVNPSSERDSVDVGNLESKSKFQDNIEKTKKEVLQLLNKSD
ncbi:MAG: hypothetical protein ACFFAO_20635 [Candidatus Hermodarchaeota archaeon]